MISSITNKRGFTLIELLTVITIVAMLAVFVLPALKSIHATSLQTGARQISSAMQLARQYAINNRVPVRFAIAVDTTVGSMPADRICRAYVICKATNDANGTIVGWIPLTDWRFLPQGILFSELNSAVSTITMPTPPPLGASTRSITGSGTTTTGWQYFSTMSMQSMYVQINPVANTFGTINVSCAEFRPTGTASLINSQGGIRLVQGSVLNPSTRNLLVNDTNNWVMVEWDQFGGRVKVRRPEDYR